MKPRQVGGPKRLLQCLSDGSVRLVETKSCNQRCEYIALSYCWGDGTAMKKTMKETVGSHHRGIPNEDLPPLFQEVAALARGLDIPYLWIDSLCIIQDSDKDKYEETMQMIDIFRGALVVVVAASAPSPLHSLLRVKPQPGQTHTWRTAGLIGYEEMDLDVKFRKRANGSHFSTNATEFTPIGGRAWRFQEKLFAGRCLVFHEDEVVWECLSCCRCECGREQEDFSDSNPWDFASVQPMEPYRKMLLPLANHEPFQLDGSLKYFADAEAAHSFWERAVMNYSHQKLTFKTDRLPAISAVASIVAEATGDRYLAGLWRDNLVAGLSWFVKVSPDSVRRPRPTQEYIAPTWSWASLPTGVWYRSNRTPHRHDADLDASVLDAWTVLEGPNPFGPVSDGAIVLSGLHCDAELTISEHGFAQLDFGHGAVQTVSLGEARFQALDFIPVKPDPNVDRLGGNPRYLRCVTDPQTDDEVQQPACCRHRPLALA